MEMTDELRQRAYSFTWGGGLKVGDSHIFPDIRAAYVRENGDICRTLNGSIMEPGTALYAFADNVPPADTCKELLAVIDAQAVRIRELEQRRPERGHLLAEGHDLDACMGRYIRNGATDYGFRGFIHAFDMSGYDVRMAMLAGALTPP